VRSQPGRFAITAALRHEFDAKRSSAAPDDLALSRMVNLTNQPYQRMVWTK